MRRANVAWLVWAVLFGLRSPARAADGQMLELSTSVAVEGGATPWATLFEAYVVYQSGDRRIVGADLETSLVRWEYRSDEVPIRRIHRRGDLLVIAAADLQLVSLRDGSVVWSFPLGCRAGGECQLREVYIDDRRALLQGFGDAPDSLLTIDLDSREQAWPSWVNVGPIRLADFDERLILVADPSGRKITAIDPAVGRVRWAGILTEGPPPVRMWTSEHGAHVFRARPGGASELISLSLSGGTIVRTFRGVTCSGGLDACGVHTGAAGAATWDVARVARGGPGHIAMHDLASGSTTMDDQAYFIGRPLLVGGRLLVLGRSSNGRVTIEGRWLPAGRLAWSRRIAGSGRGLQMALGAGVVYVADGQSGAVTGLSVRDGSVKTFGVVALDGERVAGVFPAPEALLVGTPDRVVVLRERPVDDIVGELRRALVAGEAARADELDRLVVRLASQLDEAAAAHGLVLRHALLQAAVALDRGAGEAEMGRAAELVERTPAGRPAPVVIFSVALNNLLSERFLAPAGPVRPPVASALGRLAEAWVGRLELLGAVLKDADSETRAVLATAGLQLVEALDRVRKTEPAWKLLRTLDLLPLGLEPESLPTPPRRIVAQQASLLAKRASGEARGGRLDAALETLRAALALPFVAGVIGRDDPSRLQVEVFLSGEEEPRRRELTVIAKEASRSWGQLLPDDAPLPALECLESCERRWLTCERPCVSRAACDETNLACVASCERSLAPAWPAPRASARPGAADFVAKCL